MDEPSLVNIELSSALGSDLGQAAIATGQVDGLAHWNRLSVRKNDRFYGITVG